MGSSLATEKKNKKQLFMCLNDVVVHSKMSKAKKSHKHILSATVGNQLMTIWGLCVNCLN